MAWKKKKKSRKPPVMRGAGAKPGTSSKASGASKPPPGAKPAKRAKPTKPAKARRGLPLGGFFSAGLPMVLAYGFLFGWGILAWQVLTHAPWGKVTTSLSVKAKDTPLTIGWKELGQRPGPRSAATQHLGISRAKQDWIFANRSSGKRVLLTTDKFTARFIRRWPLKAGDRISFDGADIVVTKLTDDTITLVDRATKRQATYDGDLTPKGEKVHKVCEGLLRRNLNGAKWFSRTWFSSDKPEIRAFGIGGGVNCTNRWKIVKLPPNAVWIVWQGGRFWAAPGSRRHDALFFRKGSTKGRAFRDLTVARKSDLGQVRSMILGITRYGVRAKGATLTLKPVSNRDFFFFDEISPPNHTRVSWIGAGADALTWVFSRFVWVLLGVLLAAGLAIYIFLHWRKHYSHNSWWLTHTIAALVPSFLGLWTTLLLMQATGKPDAALIVAAEWMAWFWATFMLVWTGRMRGFPGWIWTLAIILATIGTVVLFQLGAGADNTRWLGFYKKHAGLLALFGWIIAMVSIVPETFWRRMWLFIFNREQVVAFVALALIGAMILQFLMGSEEGIAGLQPVELVKSVFVVLLGYVGLHITESRQREVKAYRQSPIKYMAPYFRFAGIFFLFIASMVVGVRDFSPMVIMSVVLLAWLWKIGASQQDFARAGLWRLVRPALIVILGVLLAAFVYVYFNPSVVPDGFPQKDRIQVWANPAAHPHSGSQVLGSMDLVGQGQWWGARDWFGRNGPAMRLPAVQDDFITAFFINRFGGIAGLFMLVVQLVYIIFLFALGRQVSRVLQAGDFREQNAGVVLGFTLYGLAWMHVAHWLISWGNTLGLLPVMGQPMTWLSAGNSHLMAFALLIAFVALVTGWVANSYEDEAKGKPDA